MRLAKHLAHAGVASRRAAERLVFDGRVSVDGETVTDPARDVSGRERIEVDGERISELAGRVVYLLNKPTSASSRPPRTPTAVRPSWISCARPARGACIPSGAWTPTAPG